MKYMADGDDSGDAQSAYRSELRPCPSSLQFLFSRTDIALFLPHYFNEVRRDRPPTPLFLGFPCGSACKESTCNAGDLGSIPGLGRSPGEGKGYPLQYSGLESSMDCIVHGATKSWTQLNDFHSLSLGKKSPDF